MTRAFLIACLLTACGSKPAPVTPMPEPEPEPIAEPMPEPEPVAPEEPPAPDPAQIRAELLAVETAAFEQAKPVFDKWCAKCHSKTGKNTSAKKRKELDTTAYPFTGEHASAAEVRKVLGIGGGKVTMPADKKGAVKGDELALIAAWADAWDAAEQGGAHGED
jgi:mono/diheme cytochrome c family protein